MTFEASEAAAAGVGNGALRGGRKALRVGVTGGEEPAKCRGERGQNRATGRVSRDEPRQAVEPLLIHYGTPRAGNNGLAIVSSAPVSLAMSEPTCFPGSRGWCLE